MYALRGVDRDVLKRAKARARDRRERLDDVVVTFITQYANRSDSNVFQTCGAHGDREANAPSPDR